MPELRSGARRSKRLDNLQPHAQPGNQVDINPLPPQTRTRRRGGATGGRGRGANAGGVAKGPSARQTGAGRGIGARLINLDPEPPLEFPPEAAPFPAADLVINRVEGMVDKANPILGAGAEKVVGRGTEDDPSTAPVPERV